MAMGTSYKEFKVVSLCAVILCLSSNLAYADRMAAAIGEVKECEIDAIWYCDKSPSSLLKFVHECVIPKGLDVHKKLSSKCKQEVGDIIWLHHVFEKHCQSYQKTLCDLPKAADKFECMTQQIDAVDLDCRIAIREGLAMRRKLSGYREQLPE